MTHYINNKKSAVRVSSRSSTRSNGGASTHSVGSQESFHTNAPFSPNNQRYRIRLFAANLPPRNNVFRGRNPDTLAVVTSPVKDTGHRRNLSMSSSNSLSSADENSSLFGVANEAPGAIRMQEWGRTEIVENSRHPQWTETILFDYNLLDKQHFYVHLFSASPELKSYGTALYHVHDILSNPRRTRVRRLRTGGCLFCRLEPVTSAHHRRIRLELNATDLPRSSMKKPPTTVLEVAQRQPDTSWLTVYRSAPVFKSTEPVYDPLDMEMGALCAGDESRPLRWTIYRMVRRRKAVWSVAETSLQHILGEKNAAKNDTVLTLLKDASLYEEMGHLRISKAHIYADSLLSSTTTMSEQSVDRLWEKPEQVVEVVDLEGLAPCEYPLKFCVAIDFTSSNGDPRLDKEDSYHHLGQDGSMNDYEETITAIGSAMEKYTKCSQEDEYEVWGFGAKYGGEVQHIFQCGSNKTVHGVEGILSAYRAVFERDLVMSGPTNFKQVIRAAGSQAHRDPTHYRVLLIITDDGIMDNYEETRDMLQFYGRSDPLSVIFVGVGRSDFGMLHQLCRETPCTTFVEFRSHDHEPAALGEAALRNVPAQVRAYRRSRP